MDINEAYETVMATVRGFERQGIPIEFKPTKSRNNPRIIAKYKSGIPPEKWFHVRLFPKTDEHKKLIFNKAKTFSTIGIYFDTGGCSGERNWELDWSFRTGNPNIDVDLSRVQVEELIKNKMEGECCG